MKADWRHFVGAGVFASLLLGLLWWWALGRDTTIPTAPAPAGSTPVYDTPPETPSVAREGKR